MLKIILYSHTFLPQIGGRELVVYHLARALSGLGHAVRVLGPANWRNAADFGFPVRRYPSLVRAHLGSQGLTGSLREAEYAAQFMFDRLRSGCDVVHAHTTYPTGFTAARCRAPGARWGLVVTPHGVDIHTIPELGHGMRLRPGIADKISRALGEADALTAISGSIRTSLLEAGADPAKIWEVPNGVDCERFAGDRSARPDVLKHVPLAAPLIVTVGNYHPRKGQEFLVRAMPSILQRIPSATLVVVGRGTDRLRHVAESVGVAENVVFAGPVAFPCAPGSRGDEDVLAGLLGHASVYVSAGTEEGSEGLSLAVLEAMAAGLPVVATNISGNRDVVSRDDNGALVAPASAVALAEGILSVISDEQRRSRLGGRARATAETYGWDAVARRYVEVYESAIARRAA